MSPMLMTCSIQMERMRAVESDNSSTVVGAK